MKRFYFLMVFLIAFGSVSAQTPLSVAKDFSVKDLEGNTHHLYDYLSSGKFVVIDFFTASCGSCQVYASQVSAAYNDFGCNSGNVVFLGINWGSNNENVHAFDSIYGAFYPAISGLQGGGNRVVDTFLVLSYPTVILIAPDRQILKQYIWPPSQAVLDSIILSHGGIKQVCNVGIETNPKQKMISPLEIWPNPAFDNLNMHVEAGSAAEVCIYDNQGQLIKQLNYADFHGKETWRLEEIAILKPGLFLFILKENGTIIGTSKLVVKK